MSPENRYLTIQQACEKLNRSRWTVYRLIEAGDLVAEKKGTARNAPVFITEDSVNAYCDANRLPLAEPVGAKA
ncbi:helix-turn-helix domain-containing protein [Nonomuraea mangrovi]|uniref:Helix-turn-helix domain-containing protein n=1 Tax=Nonomuraea mangrovi TaxID=2316207 RepID=A0ABW4THZ9_9ACTN